MFINLSLMKLFCYIRILNCVRKRICNWIMMLCVFLISKFTLISFIIFRIMCSESDRRNLLKLYEIIKTFTSFSKFYLDP